MDQSAIKQIQLATSELANAANNSLENALNIHGAPFVVVPEGFKIQELNVEKHEPLRRRFTGFFRTKSINDFIEYCLGNAKHDTTCFINTEEMHAKTIINIGDRDKPGHCDDNAMLILEKTAEYTALLDKSGQRSKQKELAEWLEEYGDCIVYLNNEFATIEPQKAINSIRKITIDASSKSENTTESFRESRSAMESIEAAADVNRPEYFVFACVPYNGLSIRRFKCRISIITTENQPIVLFKVLRTESAKQEMGEELQNLIADKFEFDEKKFIKTYIANFQI